MRLILVFFFGIFVSNVLFSQNNETIVSCCEGGEGRCVGSAYCTACTNCSRCRHCNLGGSCGVCSRRYRSTSRKNSSNSYTTKRTYKSTKPSRADTNTKTYYLPNDTSSEYYLKKLIINTEILNLRSGPGKSYPVIETLKKNQHLTFLAMSGNWVKVQVNSSKTIGFVYYRYVFISASN